MYMHTYILYLHCLYGMFMYIRTYVDTYIVMAPTYSMYRVQYVSYYHTKLPYPYQPDIPLYTNNTEGTVMMCSTQQQSTHSYVFLNIQYNGNTSRQQGCFIYTVHVAGIRDFLSEYKQCIPPIYLQGHYRVSILYSIFGNMHITRAATSADKCIFSCF